MDPRIELFVESMSEIDSLLGGLFVIKKDYIVVSLSYKCSIYKSTCKYTVSIQQ